MNKRLKRSAARGFSLLELLIALTVLVAATAAGYEALRGGMMKLKQMQNTPNEGDALIALALMARDLRGATLSGEYSIFAGHGDVIQFSTMGGTEDAPEPEPVDYALIGGDLYRSVKNKSLKVCPGVTAFSARYFDGHAWHETWGWDDERNRPLQGTRGLPLMVSLRLSVDGQEKNVIVPVMVSTLNGVS